MGLFNPSCYRHTQSTASTTWTIIHNLNGNGSDGIPVVDVIVDDGTGKMVKMMPASITKVDSSTVELTFSVARAGLAVVIV